MTVRNVSSKRVQVDEIWNFTYAKQKNVARAKAAPEHAGDTWTWTALDADSKLIVSWLVGGRDAGYATEFMQDLAGRLASRVQLTSDGHSAYLSAVEDAFGADIDYAMLVKHYGDAPEGQRRYSPAVCTVATRKRVTGDPDESHISTSYVERQNLTMRMSMRRLHAADERVLEEAGEPRASRRALLRALQLLPYPPEPSCDTGDGGRNHGHASRYGVDRRSHRCAGTEARPTRTLPEAPAGSITQGRRPLNFARIKAEEERRPIRPCSAFEVPSSRSIRR